MTLILLPGNDKRNKEWIEEMARFFGPAFTETKIQFYRHWETNGGFDLAHETARLAEAAEQSGAHGIFAKSIGAILALKAISERKLNPKFCVFVGCAARSSLAAGLPVGEWLANLAIPTLFIQQTNDPVTSFRGLRDFFGSIPPHIRFAELPGSDHIYANTEELKNLTLEFVDRITKDKS